MSTAAPHVIWKRKKVEWQTLALAAVIYGGWFTVTYWQAALPWWIVTPIGAWLIAWHSQLQHEILHGHPTTSRSFNRLLASWPMSLWLPYETYRTAHLTHHRDERLTDPIDDPESYYHTQAHWGDRNPVSKALIQAQSTLLGRMVIGPLWIIPRYVVAVVRKALCGCATERRALVEHIPGVVLVLTWLVFVCKMSVLYYIFGLVYPATALMLIRSFAEHRAEDEVEERTAIVENSWILGPLFLFNNLHAAHHENPMIPWYEIPAWYKANRERLIVQNGGLVYNSYFEVVRLYLLRPHDTAVHPHDRAKSYDQIQAGKGYPAARASESQASVSA